MSLSIILSHVMAVTKIDIVHATLQLWFVCYNVFIWSPWCNYEAYRPIFFLVLVMGQVV